MNILGISAFYHDSAATIIQDGKIIAAAQEERFSRKKHDASFPIEAVRFCLKKADVSIDELDAIAFYDKPLLKFERLLETYYAFAPRGLRSFIAAMPVWLREKMFLKREIYQHLKKIGSFDKGKVKILFPEHHLSHAASAYYASPFKEAAILTIDGVGEWATATISHGEGKDIRTYKELRFPHSIGLLYSAFTYYLGFRVNSGEYKLMGLAPYGNPESDQMLKYKALIEEHLVDIKPDGSIHLNQTYFSYATGLRMTRDSHWEKLLGVSRRSSNDEILQEHCDLALAIQQVTEEVVLKMAKETRRLTQSEYLCLSGGVALNCVANGKLLKKGIFKDIFIQPASGDAGGSLGAALAAHHIYFQKDRVITGSEDAMQGAYLGPEFSDVEITQMIEKFNAVTLVEGNEKLSDKIAGFLQEGKVVGWMQGRMEFGPRALGNRSILGDPRSSEMQKIMNLKIKYRESFRPFAPSVLVEKASDYFELDGVSPYMLLALPIQEALHTDMPEGYEQLSMLEKLNVPRSSIPAVTHVDYSARIQTVSKETNQRYWELLNAFEKKTGVGLLINTSFNVRGEPIVCTPEDAYRCFMRTEMDYLVIGDFIFDKKEQPKWDHRDVWKEDFVLD
ncbi:carbamoyltransferase [Ekhidna sp.]|uniref:carbamoyltransferase family protein n=1 Tax=Ekhidna sp. TaxID=2608089 RepID=UPI003BA9BA5D